MAESKPDSRRQSKGETDNFVPFNRRDKDPDSGGRGKKRGKGHRGSRRDGRGR